MRGRHPGEQTLTADSCPLGHRREQGVILTRLAIIVAVLMALAVPCVRGTLMVLDARHRAGSPAPRMQER